MRVLEGTLGVRAAQRHSHLNNHVSPDMVDHVHPSVPFSSFPSRLHFWENNDAVIRMIIKGRSLSCRHVFAPIMLNGLGFLKELIFVPQSN